MKKKFNSVLACCMVLMAFMPTAELLANDDFNQSMVSYSASQHIADQMRKRKDIFKIGSKSNRYPNGHIMLNDSLDYSTVRKNPINNDRVKVIGKMLNQLNEQLNSKFQLFDNAVENIMNEALAYENDLTFAIAISCGLREFMSEYKRLFDRDTDDVRKNAMNKLNEAEDNILEKVQERFDDDEFKELAAEYRKLFPNEKLLFSGTAPTQYSEVLTLFNQSMRSFKNLDRYSAIADFRIWGKNMLNVLLLDKNPVLIKEFKRHLSNYKKVFQKK